MKKLVLTGILCLIGGTGFASGYWADRNDLCYGWELAADYLYWQPKRSNLFYAVTTNPTATGGTTAAGNIGTDAKAHSVNTEWNSAFRVDLMKTWTCHCFDTEARFTRFSNSSKDDTAVPSGGVIWGMRIDTVGQITTLTDGITNVSGKYDIDYNVLDLLGGYCFSFDCCRMTVRPFGGVKMAWIDERYDSAILVNGALGLNRIDTIQKNNFDLYGLTVGCENQIYFRRNTFSLHGRAGGALFWADIRRSHEQDNNGADESFLRASTCTVVPACELEVGLEFLNCCMCGCTLSCEIGYDFQGMLVPDFLYFNNGLIVLTPTSVNTTVFPAKDDDIYLALHGLHARLSVSF